jgi:hypothetical protein
VNNVPWSTSRVISSACDYLTATVRPGSNAVTLRSRAAAWLQSRVSDGYTDKPWVWQGYVGRVVDGLTYGDRDTDTIIRLSGPLAAKHANTCQTWADNVSRIDVQVTIQDSDLTRDWARSCFHLAQKDKRIQSGMTRSSLTVNTPSGATCYLGSRSSDRMLRCYDKSAESEGVYPPGTWRFEVEYKRGRALNVARQLGCSMFKPWLVAEVVQKAFADYGIAIPVPPIQSGWRDTSPREPTNDERRLEWLRTSIRPLITSLAERYDWLTLIDAIGLGDAAANAPFLAELDAGIPDDDNLDSEPGGAIA